MAGGEATAGAASGPPPSFVARLVGHRGAAGEAPENTLPALAAAAEAGVGWVELDVKLTADGVPVILHDDTLDRTTDGWGPLNQWRLADLRTLDAGGWFSPGYAGTRVPTLAEAIEALIGLDLNLNLELKPNPDEGVATAKAALGLLQAMWPADRPVPLLASFTPECLATARDQAPSWPRSPLLDRLHTDWQSIAGRFDASWMTLDHRHTDAASAAAVKRAGYALGVYTVNTPERARELAELGVDGLVTDYPAAMVASLR